MFNVFAFLLRPPTWLYVLLTKLLFFFFPPHFFLLSLSLLVLPRTVHASTFAQSIRRSLVSLLLSITPPPPPPPLTPFLQLARAILHPRILFYHLRLPIYCLQSRKSKLTRRNDRIGRLEEESFFLKIRAFRKEICLFTGLISSLSRGGGGGRSLKPRALKRAQHRKRETGWKVWNLLPDILAAKAHEIKASKTLSWHLSRSPPSVPNSYVSLPSSPSKFYLRRRASVFRATTCSTNPESFCRPSSSVIIYLEFVYISNKYGEKKRSKDRVNWINIPLVSSGFSFPLYFFLKRFFSLRRRTICRWKSFIVMRAMIYSGYIYIYARVLICWR